MTSTITEATRTPRRAGAALPRLSRRTLIAIEVIVPTLLIAAWWAASAGSTDPFFPPLSAILLRFRELWLFDHLLSDVVPSLANLFGGFILGGLAGILVGIVLGLFAPMKWVFGPVIDFWRALPAVALIPIFVSLMGFGNETRVFAIVLAAFFPVVIATMDGVRALDPQLRDVSAVYRLTRSERLFRVYLPAAGPRIASGLQVSLQASFVVMVASEMLGSSLGIGAMTLIAQQSFAIPDMWAGIILLSVIGYATNLLFNIVRDRVLRWYVRSQKIGKES
ncbi:ABC transporter permease [Microbacterium alcoholitolerans]|uniref:ABC transporter permease n=1 Tax=unclassified Microbacterium TaxID=2609290 RepID=UPI003D177753